MPTGRRRATSTSGAGRTRRTGTSGPRARRSPRPAAPRWTTRAAARSGRHEPWVGFRDATDTKETFYLFDRTDFTDGTNRTNPKKSVTVSKRTDITQQSWAVTEHRIYRITGSTNDDPPNGKGLHQLDVLDWSGKLLLSKFDITKMAISTTSDEPEGLTFTGTPGSVLAGKREGSTDPAKRSYPLWKMTNLP